MANPSQALTLDEAAALTAFAQGTLLEEPFNHAEHIRLAWLHLKRWPFADALLRFDTGLRAVVARKGVTDKYHATITWYFLVLVHERWVRCGRPAVWSSFAEANPDLLEKGGRLLHTYYRPETLNSELAREVFVLPDRRQGAAQ